MGRTARRDATRSGDVLKPAVVVRLSGALARCACSQVDRSAAIAGASPDRGTGDSS